MNSHYAISKYNHNEQTTSAINDHDSLESILILVKIKVVLVILRLKRLNLTFKLADSHCET